MILNVCTIGKLNSLMNDLVISDWHKGFIFSNSGQIQSISMTPWIYYSRKCTNQTLLHITTKALNFYNKRWYLRFIIYELNTVLWITLELWALINKYHNPHSTEHNGTKNIQHQAYCVLSLHFTTRVKHYESK